jgi:hypothetical protein
MARIDTHRARVARIGATVLAVSLVSLIAGCPEEKGTSGTSSAATPAELKLPDRYNAGEAVVLVRFDGGWTPSDYRVHRTLSRMFRDQIQDPTLAMLRGSWGSTEAGATEAGALGGSAVDQVAALIARVKGGLGLFPEEVAQDRCGNPMVAAFVTPEALASAAGGLVELPDVLSADACGGAGGCDTQQTGTWDVILSDARDDGMVDAFIQMYPAVTRQLPAYLGHLVGFFLTDNNPGYWQIPLFAAVEKVQVSITGLVQKHASYVDRHYADPREVYRFPHMERVLARNDLSVTLLGDPLCDVHHDQSFNGELPLGCNLEDGRDLALQLDRGTPLADAVLRDVLSGGTDTKPLEKATEALQYQIGAFLACPTFEDSLWVRRDNIELMVCPDGDLDTCMGFHDMEQAGCDIANTTAFPATAISAPAIGMGGARIEPSDYPYRVTQLVDELGFGGSGMELTVAGTAGQVLTLYGPDLGRITLKDGRGRTMSPVVRTDSHCAGTTAWEWSLTNNATYTISISGEAEALLLVTSPTEHLP